MIRPKDRPVDERGGMDFLGPESPTWLWWRTSTSPEFVDASGDAFFVHVDEFLELRGERGAARKTSLRAGMPGASAEGKVARPTARSSPRPASSSPAARKRRP